MKLCIIIMLSLFAILAGVIAALPTLLSIPEIRPYLLQRIGGSLQVKSIEASWFEGVLIQGVESKENDLTIHSIYWKEPLYKLFFKHQPLEKIEIHRLKMGIDKKDEIEPLVGNTIEADLSVELKSLTEFFIRGNLTSPKLTAQVACSVKDNTLQLLEPLTGSYKDTPRPTSFWVDPAGFSLALSPFSLKGLVIQSMKLEPGQQQCENRGFMALVLSLFKASLSPQQKVNLWLTPIYLSIKEGIANIERFDLLFADRYPLAAWGQINLDTNDLQMTLGISSKAIEKAFYIMSLGSEKFVQVPIRGTIDSPTFDTKRAATKITALRLQQTLSPPTIIFGTLLKAASTIGEDDTPVPPPTTQPFPWNK